MMPNIQLIGSTTLTVLGLYFIRVCSAWTFVAIAVAPTHPLWVAR